MGLCRGAVFHHGGGAQKQPISLNRPFCVLKSLVGRLPPVVGRFPACLNGLFSLVKLSWKTAH